MRIIEEEILLDRWYILTCIVTVDLILKESPGFTTSTTEYLPPPMQCCVAQGDQYTLLCALVVRPFVVVSCSNPRTVCCYVCECTALLHNWSDCYISKYMLLGETKKVKCLESFFVLLVVAISREQTPRESVEPGTV